MLRDMVLEGKECSEEDDIHSVFNQGYKASVVCQKKCKRLFSCLLNKQKVVLEEYSQQSVSTFNWGKGGMISIWVQFPASYRTVVEEIAIATINDFISGIGGNLGLFLGFSLIGTLYGLYGLIHQSWIGRFAQFSFKSVNDICFN